MIELYRSRRSALADRTEETLRDLVVAYAVHVVDDPADAPGGTLPVVCERDRVVGAAEIPGFVDELRRLVADWRRFQSDACFIGDDGEVC